ncbi:oligopeptide ABC transporter permease [Rubeoparvulum massiliense]|uniref:oligopeptide ABC transporter permease n=1 Tax=Rubeoparvulum massiliense TaxID=1631346 RepID=UPI00065E2B8F|nr:oligopeptide ABC transporter permease [Rubeoparvulum massiliense]
MEQNTPMVGEQVDTPVIKSLSPWSIAFGKFRRNKVAMISLCVLVLITLFSFLAPLISGISMEEVKRVNIRGIDQPPSSAHWFGTDSNGRDVFARLLYGGQTSLQVGFFTTLLVIIYGTVIGSLAGYFGGRMDQLLMRFTDFVLIFPALIFIIVLNTIFMGKLTGAWVLILVMSALSWGGVARMVRSKILQEKENDYILGAVSIGTKSRRIITKHLLPNVISTIIVQATLLMAAMIVLETGLSFIGFGIPPEQPSWGNMLAEARQTKVLQQQPWMWLPPAAMLISTLLSINFIGEGLKDALNPKSNR